MKELKFTCMTFTGGKDDSFVTSKRTCPTPEAAIEACLLEKGYLFEVDRPGRPMRRPTSADVTQAYCKYYVHAPWRCGQEHDGGIYTFAPEGERGAFPVWVIDFGLLKQSPEPGGEGKQ